MRIAPFAALLSLAGPAAAAEPVLLVHGLGGDGGTWEKYARHLETTGWREGCVISFAKDSTQTKTTPVHGPEGGSLVGAGAWDPQAQCSAAGLKGKGRPVFRVVFEAADSQTFRMQGLQVAAAASLVRRWTGSGTVALVGHSMGGLAARAYMQSAEYRNDVSALATVDTPHMGSLVAYIRPDDPGVEDFLVLFRKYPVVQRTFHQLITSKLSAPAVDLLKPDSEEMVALNAPASPYRSLPKGARYLNVIGNLNLKGDSALSVVSRLLGQWSLAASGRMDLRRAGSIFTPEALANWTDGVVPAASQYMRSVPAGAPLDVQVATVDAFHIGVTDLEEVWASLDRFLAESPARKTGSLEVALVLDSSGSMGENDPGYLRREGARLLADRCPPGTRFTLVRFESAARRLVDRSADAGELKGALSQIGASGGTRVCLGLGEAVGAFRNAEPGARKAVVLFTDGLSEDKCTAEDLASDGITLFSVGLSKAADGATLQAMAAATGGSYVHALTSADLQAVFDVVAAGILDEATLLDVAGRAAPGATARWRFPVDGSVSSLTGSVTWTGSDLDLSLVSPSGKRYDARAGGVVGGTYESLRVDAPEKGEWQALVKSVDVPTAGEPFRLRVTGDSPVRLSVEPIPGGGQTGRPLELAARLDGFPSGAAKAEAAVTRPDGRVVPLEARLEGDTLRATLLDTGKPGPYAVRWSANRGAVARAAQQTVFVGGAEVVSRAGELTRVEGQYAVWNRGQMHGIRPGLTIRLYRGTRGIGTARVLDVRLEECDLEVDEVTGVAELRPGDRGEVDPAEWTGEGR